MQKVLVLGASGMLGSMVYDYLSHNSNFDLKATVRSKEGLLNADNFFIFDVEQDNIEAIFAKFQPDYIINCIGIINKYCQDDDSAGVEKAIVVNSLFPYKLAQAASTINARVIQIATDCVFSGQAGKYSEKSAHDALDAYGKSKSLGEARLGNMLHIRCSIIGPELKNKASLLEWFLNQPSSTTINGYSHHQWNGVTTLQFAKLCQEIIGKGADNFDTLTKASWVHHYVPNTSVSKYELMQIFNQVFTKNQEIIKVDKPDPSVDRTLDTELALLVAKGSKKIDMLRAISELAEYMKK